MENFESGWLKGKDIDYVATEVNAWFIRNNKTPPRVAKDWKYVGVDVPPNTSITAIRNHLGLTIGQFFQYVIHGKIIERGAYEKMDNNRLKPHGLVLLDKKGKDLTVLCLGCNTTQSMHFDVATDLIKRNQTFCATCNGNTGKTKPLEYYKQKFNYLEDFIVEDFVVESDPSNFIVKHISCGNTQQVSFTHLAGNVNKSLNCIHCLNQPGNFTTTQIEINEKIFRSKIEADTYTALLEIFDKDDILLEPLYYNLGIETTKRYRADFYIKSLDIILEVTTKDYINNAKYSANLRIKLDLLNKAGKKYKLITNVNELEDIVHLKDVNSRDIL